jgi:hypothetical protein
LGNRIADLFAGRAALPDVEIAHLERVWPILVTADVTQTEPLDDLIAAALPDVYGDRRVQMQEELRAAIIAARDARASHREIAGTLSVENGSVRASLRTTTSSAQVGGGVRDPTARVQLTG